MLYLDPDEVEVHLAKNNIFKMKLVCEILKLDVQAVFNTNFKLDGLSCDICGFCGWVLDKEQLVILDFAVVSFHSDSDNVFKASTDTLV
jgi:hypothetical protein